MHNYLCVYIYIYICMHIHTYITHVKLFVPTSSVVPDLWVWVSGRALS